MSDHGCNDGLLCEAHPTIGWPHDNCPGPGMPCPRCLPELQESQTDGVVVETIRAVPTGVHVTGVFAVTGRGRTPDRERLQAAIEEAIRAAIDES